ncbi:hypothetical protein AMTRI_Chr13g90370 [Amborella trichopoda]
MFSASFSRPPCFGLIASSSRPSHSGSSTPPSRLPRSHPTTSSACGVTLAPSRDKGKFPAFSSNPPPIGPPPFYCNYAHLLNPQLRPKAPTPASKVFYRLLTWNPASPNTLASASLPLLSLEKWTIVKRKFKWPPQPFPSHNRPHQPKRSPPPLAPPNGCQSAGQAPLPVPDSCPLALKATAHAPPTTPSGRFPTAAYDPSLLPACGRTLVCTPRVPSPLVHVPRDDVNDLFASVPCPSSLSLITPSPGILSNSLLERPSSSSPMEPTAISSLSEAAPISPLLITFSPTPTLLLLSTLACAPSSLVAPSPVDSEPEPDPASPLPPSSLPLPLDVLSPSPLAPSPSCLVFATPSAVVLSCHELSPILCQLSPMVDVLPSLPFVTSETTLPLAPSSGATFLLHPSPPDLLGPCYGRSALFLMLPYAASFQPSCLVSPHSLLPGLQLVETYLALPDFFDSPLLTSLASSTPLLACLVAPLASLPPLAAPPPISESSPAHPPSFAPDPSSPPLFPLGNSNIWALSPSNFSSSLCRPSPPLSVGSSALGWIRPKVALTR